MVSRLLLRRGQRCGEIHAAFRRREIRSEATRERKQLGALEQIAHASYITVMCGRVRLSSDYSEIKIRLKFAPDSPAPNYEADWNKPPTGLMLVAIRSVDG